MVNKKVLLVLSVAVMATLAKSGASQELGRHVSVVLLRRVGTLPAPPAGANGLAPGSLAAVYEPDPGATGGPPRPVPHDSDGGGPRPVPPNPNADNGKDDGNMEQQNHSGTGSLWDRFDGKPPPQPSPSPSKSSSMEAISYAHFDDGSDTPRVIDRPNIQPATSGAYVSSIKSGSDAVINRLPANVDMALISVGPKGAVKVLTHNSDSQVLTSRDKRLKKEAKGLATTWTNQLSARGIREQTDATYNILVVRSLSETGRAPANAAFATELKLSEHVGQISSDALAKMGSDALSSLSQPVNH